MDLRKKQENYSTKYGISAGCVEVTEVSAEELRRTISLVETAARRSISPLCVNRVMQKWVILKTRSAFFLRKLWIICWDVLR